MDRPVKQEGPYCEFHGFVGCDCFKDKGIEVLDEDEVDDENLTRYRKFGVG